MRILEGNIVDAKAVRTFPGTLGIEDGIIQFIEESDKNYSNYIAPGFIDGHIHIESSMLCPSRFAEAVVRHGTTSVVTDPHEIANVMGLSGIDYMRADAEHVPLQVFFTAPSCVPATPFETSGAVLGVEDIETLLARPEVVALGEMMNFPGVINEVPEVIAKLEAAKRAGKPIDGHAPMVTGADLEKYVGSGISTDHECTTVEEAREKAELGMKIMLREGSASRNLEALAPITSEFDNCFIVSDDKHPEDLLEGHLNSTLRKAVKLGIDPIKAIAMVTYNPAEHYGLGRGILAKGMPADIVELDNLADFNIKRVFISGELVAIGGLNSFDARPLQTTSTITVPRRRSEEFVVKIPGEQSGADSNLKAEYRVRVIEIVPDNIITKEAVETVVSKGDVIESDIERDILKVAVVNRYEAAEPAVGFIKGMGLKSGAMASSVAHDSHNIIAVGTDNSSISTAVNRVIANSGGLAVVSGSEDGEEKEITSLQLPVAGLMSTDPVKSVINLLKYLQIKLEELGSKPASPFLTLSFMALLVIPELKLGDKGLFDGRTFQFVDLIYNKEKAA
jgi:adenine deaminase